MPGGESLSDVSAWAWPLLLLEDDRDPVALFIHDAVLKVILCTILSAPLGSFWRFQIATGKRHGGGDGAQGPPDRPHVATRPARTSSPARSRKG